mmetsp:Transcript_30992/g.100132  ORF Transcript_30992/g.100132 Transcript_30992/m.100132 type:complete len:221 (-) Transcript_30992:1664-2326(-)
MWSASCRPSVGTATARTDQCGNRSCWPHAPPQSPSRAARPRCPPRAMCSGCSRGRRYTSWTMTAPALHPERAECGRRRPGWSQCRLWRARLRLRRSSRGRTRSRRWRSQGYCGRIGRPCAGFVVAVILGATGYPVSPISSYLINPLACRACALAVRGPSADHATHSWACPRHQATTRHVVTQSSPLAAPCAKRPTVQQCNGRRQPLGRSEGCRKSRHTRA